MVQTRRAFTLIELGATVAAVGLVGAAGTIIARQPIDQERQRKDGTQVRGIGQALVVWAQNNKDVYPLPSKIDAADATVKTALGEAKTDEQKAAAARAKDTTANIYSLLVYNGMLSTEILVSPAEKNPSIVVKEDYQFDQPGAAANPKEALWDPAFSADFTGGKKGNVSYAHLQPCGARMAKWSNTFVATEAVVSTRGPEIKSVRQHFENGSVTPTFANPQSITLQLFGNGAAWSGNQVFNDNHVEFLAGTLENGKPVKPAQGFTYTAKDARVWPDLWNYDEADDLKAANTYIGIFTKAGAKPKDWTAIWD